jgi:tetratricopeptide (TPR) repeat protein
VISATKHRVPRWFTEGLSVHEETETDPEWGDRLTPEILSAIKKKALLPIAELDRGFIRPSYPNQVIVSYFQAGRVCNFIQSRWGWPKLLEMMRAYSKVTTTAATVESVLGMKPEEFDRQFLAWLEEQHSGPLKSFEGWMKELKPLHEAAKAKRWDDVLGKAPKLIGDYPEYVEPGNVYEPLAEAKLAKGDPAGATAALLSYARQGGRDPVILKKLAGLQESQGDLAGAEATLRRVLWIYPVQDEPLHRQLGTLRGKLGQWSGAVEEWQVVLASKPVDKASAHYELALAYKNDNRPGEARDAVLDALEEAPGYRPAQRLLLELNKPEPLEKKK